jgi:hypothetical protein
MLLFTLLFYSIRGKKGGKFYNSKVKSKAPGMLLLELAIIETLSHVIGLDP